jgi:hypothetical protein
MLFRKSFYPEVVRARVVFNPGHLDSFWKLFGWVIKISLRGTPWKQA